MSTTSTTVAHHDTDADLYAALVRVFGENEHKTTRWVKFSVDGVSLQFFAPRVKTEETS